MAEQYHRRQRARASHRREEGAGVGQVVVEVVDVAATPRRAAVAAQIEGEHRVAARQHVIDEEAVAAAVLAVAMHYGEHGGHRTVGHPGLPDEANAVFRLEVAHVVPHRCSGHSPDCQSSDSA